MFFNSLLCKPKSFPFGESIHAFYNLYVGLPSVRIDSSLYPDNISRRSRNEQASPGVGRHIRAANLRTVSSGRVKQTGITDRVLKSPLDACAGKCLDSKV